MHYVVGYDPSRVLGGCAHARARGASGRPHCYWGPTGAASPRLSVPCRCLHPLLLPFPSFNDAAGLLLHFLFSNAEAGLNI